MVMNAYKVMDRNSRCARNADHRDFPARAQGYVGAVEACDIPSVWSCIGCSGVTFTCSSSSEHMDKQTLVFISEISLRSRSHTLLRAKSTA